MRFTPFFCFYFSTQTNSIRKQFNKFTLHFKDSLSIHRVLNSPLFYSFKFLSPLACQHTLLLPPPPPPFTASCSKSLNLTWLHDQRILLLVSLEQRAALTLVVTMMKAHLPQQELPLHAQKADVCSFIIFFVFPLIIDTIWIGWTCRLRRCVSPPMIQVPLGGTGFGSSNLFRKKCDENRRSDGTCDTCKRLRLQCLGWVSF